MIHVLIGPRQVGKTTIAHQIQDIISIPTIYATADSPVPLDSAWIETQWRRAVAEGAASDSPVLLILDELQKVRGWSETLKLFWDNRPGGPEIRVLILGSSALLMQEGLTESLAGRFFLHRCTHWIFQQRCCMLVHIIAKRTFFRHFTPRRFDLLEELHRCGLLCINALAKLLKRNYKNVHDDVKALESIGHIERGEDGRYSVPWDEINTTFMHEQ